MLPACGALGWVGSQGRAPRLRRASRNALEAWLLSQVPVQAGKYLVHRHRPVESSSPFDLDGPSFSSAHLSFPSGHSSTAWAFLPAYAMEYRDNAWISGAIYATCLSTSLSRVHDGQHWFSDVFFAAGAGWISNRVVRRWNGDGDDGPVPLLVLGERTGLVLAWSL